MSSKEMLFYRSLANKAEVVLRHYLATINPDNLGDLYKCSQLWDALKEHYHMVYGDRETMLREPSALTAYYKRRKERKKRDLAFFGDISPVHKEIALQMKKTSESDN